MPMSFPLAVVLFSSKPMVQSVPLPGTPAGNQLSSFFRAFNTGNRNVLRKFFSTNFDMPPHASHFLDDTLDQQMTSFSQTAGFVVRKVETSSSAMVKVLAQAKLTGAWMEVTFYVTAKPPDYREAVLPYHVVGM